MSLTAPGIEHSAWKVSPNGVNWLIAWCQVCGLPLRLYTAADTALSTSTPSSATQKPNAPSPHLTCNSCMQVAGAYMRKLICRCIQGVAVPHKITVVEPDGLNQGRYEPRMSKCDNNANFRGAQHPDLCMSSKGPFQNGAPSVKGVHWRRSSQRSGASVYESC